MTNRPLGVFGGTFNPVHNGHLRMALETREALDLDRVLLMPAAQPPLREAPECDAEFRAELVQLAVADEPTLGCDRRELSRSGPSYTYDSLAELRAELGAERGLCLIVGTDTIEQLDRWYRWEELLDLAHLIVISRPGWELPGRGAVAEWLRRHQAAACPASLRQRGCGSVVFQTLRQLPISATEIRGMIAAGRSPRYLLPERVWERIRESGAYTGTTTRQEHYGSG